MTNQPIREALEAVAYSGDDIRDGAWVELESALSILSTALAERDARIAELEVALAPLVACMGERNFAYPFHGVTVEQLRNARKALKESSRG